MFLGSPPLAQRHASMMLRMSGGVVSIDPVECGDHVRGVPQPL